MKTARALDQIAKQRVVLICPLNEQYFSLINHHNLSPRLPVNFFPLQKFLHHNSSTGPLTFLFICHW